MTMRFFQVISVQECIRRLSALPLMPETLVPRRQALGLALARDVASPENLPPADRAAMDGYAVRSEDLFGVTEGNPAYLQETAKVPVNAPATRALGSGECMGIVTGAWMPKGADAVLMGEHSEELGAGAIEARRSVAPGENVMHRADDAEAGAVALPAGTGIRPQEMGLLAALGIREAFVHSRPEVALLSSGDEIVSPDKALEPGQMRDVNSTALAAILQQNGFAANCCGIVPDSSEHLTAALTTALDKHDVVFLSGGSSLGIRDYTLEAISGLPGAFICAQGVAIKPGKPLIVGHIPDWRGQGARTIWGLPGQAGSAQVVMHVLGLPFLRQTAGWRNSYDQSLWPARRATLARNIASAQGREEYIRVRLEPRPGLLPLAHAVTAPSGLLRSLLEAHGLVRIPAPAEGLTAGAEVDCLLV